MFIRTLRRNSWQGCRDPKVRKEIPERRVRKAPKEIKGNKAFRDLRGRKGMLLLMMILRKNSWLP